MGQRTQLYIIEHRAKCYYNENNPNNKERETRVYMFHNQWGYGYRQLLDALAYILSNRGIMTHKVIWDNGDDQQPNQNPTHYNKSWLEKDITDEAPKGNLFDRLDIWRNCFLDYGDNNNGIIVIELFRDSYEWINWGNIQCFRGGEDTPQGLADGEPMTIWDYINQYTEEIDKKKVYKIIKSVLDLMDIKEQKDTKKISYIINQEMKSIYLPKDTTNKDILEYIANNEGKTLGDTKSFLQNNNIKVELKGDSND